MSGFKGNLSKQQEEALVAFRARLSDDLSSFSTDSKIILWGVELQVDNSKTDVILLKFLRAREFKVQEAATALLDCLRWRKEFKVDEVMTEEFPEAITSLGFIHKHDKDGRPVMYNVYGNIDIKQAFEAQGGIDRFIRWRVQLMETAIQQLDMDKIEDMVIIHDYNGASMLKMDANMKAASKTLIELFQKYYPELLARKFFINIPWFFEAVYSVVSLLVNERTKSKFVLCSKDSIREKLISYIPVENLPREYGGMSETKRTNTSTNLEDKNQGRVEEVVLDTGKDGRYEVKVVVEEQGTVYWEFTAISNDVGFSARLLSPEETKENVRKDEKKLKETDFMVPYTRSEGKAGSFIAPSAGTYLLLWDNTYSLFAKKKIYHRVFVDNSTSVDNRPSELIPTTDASTLD
eukprot:TRINITY_DN9581_c0_g1_i1.p1 TRINITY_DN9581_c0_g1~~TRINITY_DN9581_c0_g1_i1.p1  ORF type:complete len:406 (-),score=105.25 TRINITY_DN9581_c0_g1_i1:99-1316(-)